MTDYSEEQLKEAARRAYKDGNMASAQRLIKMARQVAAGSGGDIDVTFTGNSQSVADMSLTGRIKDNILGVDDGIMSPGEKLGTLLNMGGESLTLGVIGDEVAAVGDSLIGRGSFDERLAINRQREAQLREENPVISFGADVAPALLVPGMAAAKGASLAAKVAKGSVAAGGAGALFGFAEGEGGAANRAQNAALTGGISMALGGAAPVVARQVSKVLDKRKLSKAVKEAAKLAPDGDELKAQASALFDKARSAPVAREDFATQVPAILAEAKAAGMRSTPAGRQLAPKSAAIVQEIGNAAEGVAPMAFDEIHDLRKLTNAATGDFNNPFDQNIGQAIRKGIDDAVDSLDGIVSGELAEANKMWKVLRKSEQLDEVFANASRQASGFENGLRVQFRAILNSPKKRNGFTKAEQAAMEEVVKGTGLGNLMKKIGKLGFGRGSQSNVLSGTAGAAVFGPAASVAGQAALSASEGITSRRAKAVQDLVRIGGAPNVQIGNQVGNLEALLLGMSPRAVESLRDPRKGLPQ